MDQPVRGRTGADGSGGSFAEMADHSRIDILQDRGKQLLQDRGQSQLYQRNQNSLFTWLQWQSFFIFIQSGHDQALFQRV